MIRIICKSGIPRPWTILSRILYPSIERLDEITKEAYQKPSSLSRLSDEFSLILQDLRINWVWKWTGRYRLRGMDRLLSEFASRQGWKKIRILDIGASDGSTTLATVEYINEKNQVPVLVTLMDRDTRLLCIKRHGVTLYLHSLKRPLMIRLGRIAFCLEPMDGIEGIVFNKMTEWVSNRYAAILKQDKQLAIRTISLINPAVEQNGSIEVVERDLFNLERNWIGMYDVVRASNVINLSYYSKEKIKEAIRILYLYVREGGVLLVSRNLIQSENDGETESGGMWQKIGNGFNCISTLNQNSEISELIDQFDDRNG